MKKKQTASKTKEQASLYRYEQKRTSPPSAESVYADPNFIKPSRRFSYSLNKFVREEPAELPRFFIKGLVGGSFRLDLRGLNVDFSDAATAHWVADESMRKLDIHRGDIIMVDPEREMQPGDLLLLCLDGQDVLRLLSKKKGVWFLETVDDAVSKSRPLVDQVPHGVVLGILRLFTKVKPVRYRGTEANFGMPVVRGSWPKKTTRLPTKTQQSPKKGKSEQRPFLLAAEEKSPFRLSDTEKKPYRA